MTKLPASRLRDISIDASVLCKESPPAKLYILNHIETRHPEANVKVSLVSGKMLSFTKKKILRFWSIG